MNEREFIEFYKKVLDKKMPYACGYSFSASQYADLMDLIIFNLNHMKFEKSKIQRKYMEWVINEIRPRKEHRFYNDYLHRLFITTET
jgi:hypothetical protein